MPPTAFGGLAALISFASGVAAPGVQTGDLTGVVRASDGTPIPGTVSVTSTPLPGDRPSA